MPTFMLSSAGGSSTGAAGPTGAAGAAGNQGGFTFSWVFTTATSGTSTNIAFNNTTYSSVTNIYVATTVGPISYGTTLASIGVGDVIKIYLGSDYNRWVLFTVSGAVTGTGGSFATIPVTFISTNGAVYTGFPSVWMSVSKAGTAGSTAGVGPGAKGTVPSLSAGTGAGTSPTLSIASPSDDSSGVISVTAGIGALTNSLIVTLTFSTAYGAAPKTVSFWPMNGNAASISGIYLDKNNVAAASFQLKSTGTALSSTVTYDWGYLVCPR